LPGKEPTILFCNVPDILLSRQVNIGNKTISGNSILNTIRQLVDLNIYLIFFFFGHPIKIQKRPDFRIAAAFYPNKVIVRFSDFKSNEYYNLLGGKHFEPHEENPMIGWRGASRYYSDTYKAAFGLECKAIKKVREDMGLDNVVVMIPFCRTVDELHKVHDVMKAYGLERGKAGLELFLMAEIPSNIILAEEFAKYIDGFSIGSNDLTQLTMGLDRDSSLVAHLYDERNPAVKQMLRLLIDTAKRMKVKVGICGQGPSDFPDFAQFLVELGIDSISVTPDSVVKTVKAIAEVEKKIGK